MHRYEQASEKSREKSCCIGVKRLFGDESTQLVKQLIGDLEDNLEANKEENKEDNK